MANFNPNQLKVIEYDGGNVVVSASAGSGKTTVMIERLIRLIASGKCGVRDVLCVTFTKKAAAEMKDKLSSAIVDKIKRGEDVERMRDELSNLPLAAISTVDSFLYTLVSKYFYLAGVDSKFSIIDSADSAVMKNTALSEVFERLYEANDEDILLLLRTFIKGRSDRGLKDIILSVYTFMESEIDGFEYLKKAVDAYTEEGLKKVENRLIGLLLKDSDKYRDKVFDMYVKCRDMGVAPYENYYFDYLQTFDIIKNQPCENGIKTFASWSKSRPRLKAGQGTEELKKEAEELNKQLSAWKKDISTPFALSWEDRLAMTKESGKIIRSLDKVIRLFDEEYSKQKADKNLLDYSDLSKKAYFLLSQQEVKEELSKNYKYIFVDEYQDTNGVQEGIFRLLENNNLFIVGDVKQSIYGFRGCNSDIFAHRMTEAEKGGYHIGLNENYRSSKAVIAGVNNVFSRVMTEDCGGVDYASAKMIYGGLYGDFDGEAAIYCIARDGEDEPCLLDGVYSVEKHLAANKTVAATEERLIHYLVNKSLNKSVFDIKSKKERPTCYGDIAILVRTNSRGDKIARELSMGGIPVVTESGRSIGDYPEIKQLINILECIYYSDNDVALAAALKSPMGDFSDEDLLAVRKLAPKKTFVEAAYTGAAGSDEIGARLKDFFKYLDDLRTVAKVKGVPTLLRKIIKDTNFDVKTLAERGGELKLKRIEGFISQSSRGGRELSVGEFLKDKEALLKEMTLSIGGDENAVHILSMHSSKGLEWPVVIVAGLSANWNTNDNRNELIVDRDGGLGLKYYDPIKKVRVDTNVYRYVKACKEDANQKDELRLMYVAMTRARCRLYVVNKKPIDGRKADNKNFRGHAELLMATDMSYIEVPSEDLSDLAQKDERRKIILPSSVDRESEAFKRLSRYVSYQYPHEKDTGLSIKRTVTDISQKGRDLSFDEPSYRPIFGGGDIESGNAYHRVLELADFEKIGDNGYIEALLNEKLTDDEKKAVDLDRVRTIFGSEIFKRLKGYKLYKEHPFVVTIPPEMAGEAGEEEVLVQGVIDLLAISGDEAVIVDYKYSHKSRDALISTYYKQLELYRYAVERATGKRVRDLIIFNLISLEVIEL